MPKHIDLDPGQKLPSFWTDALQEVLSGLLNFTVRTKPGTPGTLQVPAGTGNDQVGLIIEGKWRYVTANVERANIGGAARTLDLFATASANTSTGDVDTTDHAFALALVEHSATPSGVAHSRKVAEVVWDGAAFTGVALLSGGGIVVPADQAPVGAIMDWPAATPPTNWRIMDGSAISRTTYADLFALFGTTYGVGNGTTTFNLPNAKGKVVVQLDAAEAEFDALGETGGAKTHTLTVGQLPEHTHQFVGGLGAGSESRAQLVLGGLAPYGVSEVHVQDVRDASGNPVTNGLSHPNLQPYLVLNKIMRVL